MSDRGHQLGESDHARGTLELGVLRDLEVLLWRDVDRARGWWHRRRLRIAAEVVAEHHETLAWPGALSLRMRARD